MKDYFELRSLQRIAIRWWWLLILFAVGFGLIGYFVSVQLHRVYEASATVLVGRGTQATELSRLWKTPITSKSLQGPNRPQWHER